MVCDGGWEGRGWRQVVQCRVTVVIAEPFENLLKCEMHGGFFLDIDALGEIRLTNAVMLW